MIKRVTSIVRRELGATFVGTGQFYLGYVRMLLPTHGAIHWRAISVVMYLIPLVFLFGHPWFPGWLKMTGAIVMMLAVSMVAREFVGHARKASYETRPAVRGALLGLFPFFLASVAALVWGMMQVIGQDPTNPWMVNLNPSFPAAFPPGPEHFRYDATMALGDDVNGFAYWCYAIQATLGVPTHWIFEKVSGGYLNVARLWAWNEPMMALEFVLQIISASLFVGILVDIGLAVQHKVSLGDDIGADLAENFGHTMLDASRGLNPDDIARLVHAEEGMRQIRNRAFAYLRDHLRNKDPRVRARAARALGEWNDRRAGALLAATFRDEPEPVARVALAESIGAMQAPEGLDELVHAIRGDDSPEVVRAASRALGDWAPRRSLAMLVDSLEGLPPARSAEVAHAIADVISSGSFHEAELPGISTQLLTSRKDEVRTGLFLVLADLCDRLELAGAHVRDATRKAMHGPLQDGLDAARKELKRVKKDDDLETEIRAAIFLGSAVSWLATDDMFRGREKLVQEAVGILVRALADVPKDSKHDHRIRFRSAALTSLGRLGGTAARDALVDHLRIEPETVALAAISALGQTKDPDAVDPLVEVLEETGTDRPIRHDAICRALGRLGDERARKALEDRVASPAALRAIGGLGDGEAIPVLLNELQKPDNTFDRHGAVLMALGFTLEKMRHRGDDHVNVPPARAQLTREFQHARPALRPTAAEAYARALGADGLPMLRKALKADRETAIHVAEGIIAVQDAALLTGLTDELPETDVDVQSMIVGALSALEPEALTHDMLAKLNVSMQRLGAGTTRLLAAASARFSEGLTTVRGGASAPFRFFRNLVRSGEKDDA